MTNRQHGGLQNRKTLAVTKQNWIEEQELEYEDTKPHRDTFSINSWHWYLHSLEQPGEKTKSKSYRKKKL